MDWIFPAVLTVLAALGQPGMGVAIYNALLSSIHESIVKKAAAILTLPGGFVAGAWVIYEGIARGRAEAWFFSAGTSPVEFLVRAYFFASALGGLAVLVMVAINPRRQRRPLELLSNHSLVVRVPRRAPWPYGPLHRAFLFAASPVNELSEIEVSTKEITLPNLPAEFGGLRIAQLTDLHVGTALEDHFYRRAVEIVQEQHPDIIALTGDLVSRARHIPRLRALLEGLEAPLGMFLVRGNHDFWTRPQEIRAIAESLGFACLDNRAHIIQRRGSEIALIGVEDPYGERIRNWGELFSPGLPACRIALLHTPDVIRKVAARGCDLALAGHTHGGQVQFPVIGVTLSPSLFGRRYASGWKRVGNTLLYTCRGLGAFFPVRFMCRPEIPIFILRSAAAENGRSTPPCRPPS